MVYARGRQFGERDADVHTCSDGAVRLACRVAPVTGATQTLTGDVPAKPREYVGSYWLPQSRRRDAQEAIRRGGASPRAR